MTQSECINSILVISALILSSSPALAERTLSADEVNKLFKDKTVDYYHEKKGIDIRAYYAPDGTLRGVRGGNSIDSKWSVDSEGKLCINHGDGNKCLIIVDDDGVYKKYKVKDNSDKVLIITYKKFTDGNPDKY